MFDVWMKTVYLLFLYKNIISFVSQTINFPFTCDNFNRKFIKIH